MHAGMLCKKASLQLALKQMNEHHTGATFKAAVQCQLLTESCCAMQQSSHCQRYDILDCKHGLQATLQLKHSGKF